MSKQKRLLSYLPLAALWLAAYIRIFLGTDVTDEGQYLSSAYLPVVGGKPFVHELFVQQSGSLIYSPFVWLWVHVVGSTTGLALGVRHLYFFFAVATALSFTHYLRRSQNIEKSLALLLSTVFLTFTPGCVPNLGYNSIAYLAFANFLIWTLSAWQSDRKSEAALGGAFAALTFWAYPTLAVPIALLYVLGLAAGFRRSSLWRLTWIAIAATTVLLVVTLPLLLLYGWDNLLQSYVFTRMMGSGWGEGKLLFAYSQLQDLLPPWPYVLGCFAFSLALGWWRRELLGVALMLTLVVLFAAFSIVADFGHSSRLVYNQVGVWFLSSVAGILWLVAQPRSAQAWVVVLSAMLGALTLTISSGAVINSAALSVVALLPLGLAAIKISRRTAVICALALNTLFIVWTYGFFYRDYSLPYLTSLIEVGPYAGIFTNEKRAELFAQIQEDLRTVKDRGEKIFFYESFPAGYVMSDKVPTARSLYVQIPENTWPVRPFYAAYFEIEENRPDIVFDFKYLDLTENERLHLSDRNIDPAKDPLRGFFVRSGEYSVVISRDNYNVLVRRKR